MASSFLGLVIAVSIAFDGKVVFITVRVYL